MVRRLNHHRPADQNRKLQSRKEPSTGAVILLVRVSEVRLLVVCFGSVDCPLKKKGMLA